MKNFFFIFLLQYHFIFLSQYCVQKYCVCIGPYALFTRDIFTHNNAIKRYRDKNIFLNHGFKTVQGKLLTKH